MEEVDETDSDWAHFPSPWKSDPSNIDSMSIPSSSFKIPSETYSVSQQDDKIPGIQESRGEQLPDCEAILMRPLAQSSYDSAENDRRNDATKSVTENTGEQTFSYSLSRNNFPSEKEVVGQELHLDEQGSRHRVSESVDFDGFLTYSSDGNSTSGNSPRSSSKMSTSDSALMFNEDVGPSSSNEQDIESSSSNIPESNKRPVISNGRFHSQGSRDPHEMSNSGFHDRDREGGSFSHFAHFPQEELPTGTSSGRPRLHQRRDRPREVPIEVYVIAPKSVEDIEIQLEMAVRYKLKMADFSLGKGIDGKLFAWCCRGRVLFSPHEVMSVSYLTKSEEKDLPGSLLRDIPLASSFKNHVLDVVWGEKTSSVNRVRLPNLQVHVDVCNDEGLVKTPQEYTLMEWLAVLRTLIASTSKYSFRDTFAEYFHKRPTQLVSMFKSGKQYPSEAFKLVVQWASHLQEEFKKEFDSSPEEQSYEGLVAKQGLVSVALLEMLVALRNLPSQFAIKEEDLVNAFLETLVPLGSFFEGVRSDPSFLQQEAVGNVLQATMGHLVSCVSPFKFEWVDYLDLFAFFDPTLEFLNGWNPFRFGYMGDREISKTGVQYEDAIRKLCQSSCFRSSPERLAASGSALKAAPTIREFFQAAEKFEKVGWLLGRISNESAAEHVHLMDEALDKCFSNITEQPEKSGGRKARLQRQLEIALNVEASSVYPFLAASFRDHLLVVFQEILYLEAQSQGVIKDSLSFVKSRGSTISDTMLSLVTSPHAFTTPLRSHEVRLIGSLSTTPNSKIYASGRAALVSLANRETLDAKYHEVLKVWIQGAARRKVSTGELAPVYLPPHSFLAALEELLGAGIEPSLASSLSQMAMSMAVEECPNLPAFLQDSKKITLSQARVVQDHYLDAAGRMMEAVLDASQTRSQLGEAASASLLAICQQGNRGMLSFQNRIGEHLCVKLLDTTMKACSDLRDELQLRPIETIVEFKFATLMMQIEKCPQSIKSHPLYEEIYRACLILGRSLKSQSVSLRYINLSSFTGDWEKIFQILGNASYVAALEQAHKDLVVYKKRLQGFKMLVYNICGPFLTDQNIIVERCTMWRDWLVRRSSEWENFTLNEIHSSPDHWPSEVHKTIYDYLDPVVTLHGSRIFLNVFVELVLNRAGGNDGLVKRTESSEEHEGIIEMSLPTVACVIFPQAVNQYRDEMRLFVATDINFDKIMMERVCILLYGVDSNAVETEFEFARRELGWGSTKTHDLLKRLSDKETNIVDYLKSWKGINVLRELHAILPLVASVFDLNEDSDGLVPRIWNVITECTPRCSLRRFREVLQRDGQSLLAQFSTSEVDTLKELTKSGQLIMFLRESVQEDLRHLLDAVEDPNATQTWEGLINDLIDLQRIFRPILSAKTVSFEDLRASITGELITSSSSSNHLCEKLKACNKEAHGLRQYFLGVANRMYKDNDQIAGILRSGKYHFSLSEDGCFLELKCSDAEPSLPESSKTSSKSKALASSQGGKSYNLAQLQELRSRARWTISSNSYVKKSKAAQAFGADWAGTEAETIETTEKCAIVFISHIDVAEQIVAILTELHNCGHFSYAKFQRVVPSFAELQTLTDLLKFELLTWKAAMLKARNEFLCLNFFRSVELRLIVDVLMHEKSTQPNEKLEHCLDLFKWTGVPSIDLVAVKRLAAKNRLPQLVTQIADSSHDGKDNRIYNCLGMISSVMESSIFEKKLVKTNGGSAPDKSKGRQRITLVDVNDPQGEIDAVATLFAERDLILHGNASNVIVCGPLTAWEDLYLLTLRFLNNAGRKDYFYCIAYVERLSFDCQAHLLALLQDIIHECQSRENELALVSSRSKTLHALAQCLQIPVRHMAAGTTGTIGNEGDDKYNKMWVITSDLPGMGKTRFVQKFAETNYKNCIRTLAISGEVSRNLLIQRLKKLFMDPPNQSASSIFLHLDISVVGNPETLNDLLFELLVLGCLKSDRAGLFHLDTQMVAIEVANTYHNYLASKLPICRWFKTEHVVWNMLNFVPRTSVNSDDQFVCNYLQHWQDGNADKWNPDVKEPGRNIVTISYAQCRELLHRHFVVRLKDKRSISFSLLQTFTKFFAQQLREFSECPFFIPEYLAFMRAQPNTRSTIVNSILEVSLDLSIRSVKPWLDEQQEPTVSANTEVLMAARMDNMQRWSDSKHVMIFFQLKGRMAILYKDLRHVPITLVDLFHKQKAKLPHYESLTSEELYGELWPILHRTQPPARDTLYVLTADNFLKMALIFTKVKADVPVVIMGETGCGKTSLLRQLAHYCCVTFLSITLHAGTTEDDIRKFLIEAETQASNHVVWAFLDEINACDHLGFLAGVVCHHLLDGRPLHHSIKVLAACNPYRKHDSEKQRAGLSAREMLKSGNVQHLDKAYTVHPLPEALVETVQDFGILNAKDEQLYIQAMVLRSTANKVMSFPFIKLLVMSQAFVKKKCGEASVSLRDVRRCIDLYIFFKRDLENRPQSTSLSAGRRERRAALLSFAHCYYYRLASGKERTEYKAQYVATMNVNKWRGSYTEKKFEKELFEEQMSLLDHMEIPPGIAKNQALRENVFVTLTCILQKIPLFVVGKPGSGKTLSLQLIFSNLRGSGMKDPYFRQKPTMFMFSYQGSESSTSQGILRVFEKAYRCVEDNKKKNVNAVVVVVLDEIGLAEISSHNPLKVLHSLLEPDGDQQVAVVGISNWSLDAAKMNRAIHISQPDPSVTDLVATGEAILDSYGMRNIYGEEQMTEMMWLAKVYHEYHQRQSKPDFHGLRDFYSLIKSLRGDEKFPKKWTSDDLRQAVWRNFEGSPNDTDLLKSILCRYFRELRFDPLPALDLVKANLEDKDARHLMLISTGESAIGIIEGTVDRNKLIIVHGSKYKDDCSDDYAYLMLSNIILHMEHGRRILLKGVERVWSSLYDMLNQHYTIVGGRRNCRIAIGAFSNPMCYVHDNFRCIVLVDQSQVQSLDPPFLNRFEKQVLTWEAMLTPQQKEAVECLNKWVKAMACISEDDSNIKDIAFCENDLFANYSADTLASLVSVNLEKESPFNNTTFLERCKEELLLTAYPDGIMRAHYSQTCLEGAPDAKTWTYHYFQKRSELESLLFKIHHHIDDKELWKENLGFKLVVTTRSNVHTNIRLLLKDLPVKMQIIKLGDFTAERQLNASIQQWSKSVNDLLIIQSDTVLDKDHLPLAKVHVERARADLLAQAQSHTRPRHVVFILHSHRGEQQTSSPFSFLSGWKQITLDQLHQEDTDYSEYLDASIAELVRLEKLRESHKLMVKVLTWSFLCIKYPRGKQSASYCQRMVENICNDKDLYECFIQRAVVWLEEDATAETGKVWQTSVVCNRGRLALASNLHCAFSRYIEEKLREPIARLIYVLESKSSLGSYFNMTHDQKALWRRVFMDRQTINIENVQQPMHPEGYTIQDPMDLKLPFSSLYAEHVDKLMQELYLARVSDFRDDDAGAWSLALGLAKDVSASLQNNESMLQIEECVKANPHDYCHDFAMLYAPYQSSLRSAPQSLVFEWLLREKVPDLKPLMLHALSWTKLETLKAQALLASSCYTEDEISTEVKILKEKANVVTAAFDRNFASYCVLKMLPSDKIVIEKAGGLEKWLHQFDILIKLVSNINIEGPNLASIMLMLRVLQDFARLVVCPLSISSEDLCSLSHWFKGQKLKPSPESLITKITGLVPDMNTLRGKNRDVYFRFVASTFSRLLESKSVTLDVISTMSTVIFHFKAPTCLMKGVMVRLLNAAAQLLIPAEPKLDCPPCLQLLLLNCRNFIKELAWGSESYEPFILLSDVIYESVRASITPALMSGVSMDREAFSCNKFFSCVRLVTRELTFPSGALNLRVATSFAVLRSIMDVLAQDLVTVQRKDSSIFKPRLAPAITKVLTEFFLQSHYNVLAMKQYLMKVLRYHCGFSIQNVSYLANECRSNKALELYSLILDWEMLKEVDNPLGFNPYTTLFPSYEMSDELLWNTIYCEGDELQKLKVRIQDLRVEEQGAMASVVASKIFLVKASRKLFEKEVILTNWLLQEASLQCWDKKWEEAIHCLAGTGPLQLSSGTTTSDQLQFRALAAHILLVVSSFTSRSPLRGYMTLEVEEYVLSLPDNLLAALQGALSRERLGEYKHVKCGYVYVIGNCTMPAQRAKCPGCGGSIGGWDHTLDAGNVPLQRTIEKGYIPDHVARSDTMYTVRALEMKSFRALRLVVHYCILLGLYMGRSAKKLAPILQMPESSIIKEVETLIEEDLVKLGTLLNCNREVTCQFMHSIVASMANNLPEETLSTPEKRHSWETSFGRLVKSQSERNVHQSVAEYIDAHRGRHELTEMLEERRRPPFPTVTAAFTRISVVPNFKNYQAMYMQDETRRRDYPIVEKFFAHIERLSEMKHLLGLLRFSKAVHEQLWSKITRPEAASMTVGEYLSSLTDEDRRIQKWFPEFARAWNVMRLKVTAFECTEFKQRIPEMKLDTSIGFCFVEPRDLGVYLAAILDYLRMIQNTFLDEVAAAQQNQATTEESNHRSVKVQMCKAEEVIDFNEQWPDTIICHAAMANLQYSQGQNSIYDDYSIAQDLQNRLVDQKPHLDQWEPFLYKHEAFHKHMTILSDVGNLVTQIPLGPEILQGIQRDIELGTVGAGRYLAILDLCLGFLRRTGGDPTETLGSYCERWLGEEALLITRMHRFNKVQLQHIVCLYEGLEDSASVGIQGLVNSRYRTPLSPDLVEELRSSVEVKRPWQHTTSAGAEPKISAELFHGMLRRFLFRYLIGDQLNATVPLSIYITDPRLIQWPDDVVDDVDEIFPPSLLVEHSHATYVYLSEMLKVGSVG